MDSWLDTLRLLPYSIYLKWMMLLIPAGMLLYWQRASRKNFEPYLDHPSKETQSALYNVAKMRGWAVILLWVMLSVTLITYDLRFPLREDAPSPAPRIVENVPPVSDAPMAQLAGMPVEEPQLDLLKSRYEDAFLSFFYLRQCNASRDEDYQQLYINFKKQLAAAGADDKMVENTVSAAMGSFETIYSGAPCDAKYLNPMQERFRQMMAALAPGDAAPTPSIK